MISANTGEQLAAGIRTVVSREKRDAGEKITGLRIAGIETRALVL